MPAQLRHFYFLFFLGLVFFTGTGRAHALNVDQIRFGVHPDKVRMVLDLSENSDFRVFILSDPYRMVIDLPQFGWNASPVGKAPKSNVTAVRHGNLQPGISRIVFDFDRPVTVRNAFTLPRQGKKPNRLVIDYAAVHSSEFNRNKNTIFGGLQVENPGIAKAAPPHNSETYQTASLSSVAPPTPSPKTKKPLIVIDPGHGGVDPGAVGHNDLYEKKVVLALAKELKKQLEDTGQYRVLLTREDDVFIRLHERVKFARKHEADLFVSIHADSLPNKNVGGTSVYTLSDKASDAQTEKLAARENRADLIAGIDLSVEDEEVANILVDLAMRDTMNQSRFFANKLVDTIDSRSMKLLEKPHRYAGFAVLKAPDIPSVLVEAGFMSNKREAEQLNSPDHRKKLANALKAGIDAYFEQVRKNQRI